MPRGNDSDYVISNRENDSDNPVVRLSDGDPPFLVVAI
jgi:hypothetical protein